MLERTVSCRTGGHSGFVVCAGVLLSACSAMDQRTTPALTSDSGGVLIVENSAADVSLARRHAPVLIVGGAADEHTPLSILPQGIALDPRGGFYVLAARGTDLVHFDAAGSFRRTIGRRGDGPGELSGPTAVLTRSDGSIWVVDMRKRALVGYDSLGAPREQQSLRLPYRGGNIRSSDDAVYLPTRVSSPGTGGAIHSLLRVTPFDTTVIGSMTEPAGRHVEYAGCDMSLTLPPLFAPPFAWDARDSVAVVARAAGYVLDLYVGTRHAYSIRRGIPVRTATRHLAISEVGSGEEWSWGTGSCRVPPAVVVEQRGYAPTLPGIARVALSPSSEIWVERYAPRSEPRPIDVFSFDGSYRGTLPAGTPWPVLFIDVDRYVALETDSLDVDRLVVYRRVGGQ